MPLLPTLKSAAVERGLIASSVALDAGAAFALVRDLPYRPASTPEPQTTIAEWGATHEGRHILLQALFAELGMPATIILAPHEFTEASAPWLPPALLDEIQRQPVADVHSFLRVQPAYEAEWMTVDATWPLASRALGLPVNEAFVAGSDMAVAVDPIEIHHVPPDADPMELMHRMVDDLTPDQQARREAFLGGLIDWLEAAIPSPNEG